MSLEKYRKSASEMDLEARVAHLYMMINHLSTCVKMALPCANVPDLGQYGYVASPLDGAALLSGRGPRFIAAYNLAQNDEERKKLLDSLPSLAAPTAPFGWNIDGYLREYRLSVLDLSWGGSNVPMSKEWQVFIDGLSIDKRAQEFDGTLEEYSKILSTTIGVIDDPILLRIKDSGVTSHVILLPVHEITGYLVVALHTANHNGKGIFTTPQRGGTFRWAKHENCWAYLQDFNCSNDVFARVLERFALWLGYPPYEPGNNDELYLQYVNIAQKIQDVWLPMVPTDFVGKMVISVPDILVLTIEVPRPNYYGYIEFKMRPLDIEEDKYPFSGMRAASDKRGFGQVEPTYKSLEDFQRSCPIPFRQRRRVQRLMEQFLSFEAPTIEFLPNPD